MLGSLAGRTLPTQTGKSHLTRLLSEIFTCIPVKADPVFKSFLISSH